MKYVTQGNEKTTRIIRWLFAICLLLAAMFALSVFGFYKVSSRRLSRDEDLAARNHLMLDLDSLFRSSKFSDLNSSSALTPLLKFWYRATEKHNFGQGLLQLDVSGLDNEKSARFFKKYATELDQTCGIVEKTDPLPYFYFQKNFDHFYADRSELKWRENMNYLLCRYAEYKFLSGDNVSGIRILNCCKDLVNIREILPDSDDLLSTVKNGNLILNNLILILKYPNLSDTDLDKLSDIAASIKPALSMPEIFRNDFCLQYSYVALEFKEPRAGGIGSIPGMAQRLKSLMIEDAVRKLSILAGKLTGLEQSREIQLQENKMMNLPFPDGIASEWVPSCSLWPQVIYPLKSMQNVLIQSIAEIKCFRKSNKFTKSLPIADSELSKDYLSGGHINFRVTENGFKIWGLGGSGVDHGGVKYLPGSKKHLADRLFSYP